MHKHCTSTLVAGYYATLPGASATVDINFSNISTRLRNQLISGLNIYPKKVKGWGKTHKMMDFLWEYYKFDNSHISEDSVSLHLEVFDNQLGLVKEVIDYCKADLVAKRLGNYGNESYKYEISNEAYEYEIKRLDESYESGCAHYYSTKVFASPIGLQLLSRISEVVREKEKDKLDEALDVVKNGRCLTMHIN